MAHVELASSIPKLIKSVMQMNVFLVTMKCAELSPLYKKDDNLLKHNLRPVSALTGIWKLHESVVNDQLLDFFCKLFNDLTSAFRKSYGCLSLFVKYVHNWKISTKTFCGPAVYEFVKGF